MIRSEIIKIIGEVLGNKEGFWLITGAAMVMYGIKLNTTDIDIGCTENFFRELQSNGYSVIKKNGYPNRIQINDFIEVLEGIEVTDIKYIEGIPVCTITDIVKFKKKLNRKKDREDLQRIENYIQHINMRTRRFHDILDYCKKNVPYYQEQLEKVDIENKDILLELPIVDKKQYVENSEDFLSELICKDDVVWEFTSGSTGQPLSICKSKRERIIQGWTLQTNRRENGLALDGSIMIRFHNYVNESANKEILKEPVLINGQIYFPVLYFNDGNIKKLCQLLQRYEKVWIYGTPSQVFKLCDLLNEGFPLEKITYIELFGEVLFGHQKERILSTFKCPVRNMYGCHEVWAIAYECACGNMHILENNVILEILDKNGKNVGYNKEGEIVITILDQRTMPFIRYRIGDRGIIRKSECLCGKTSDILELSAARIADDILMKNGKRISSIIFLHVLMLVNQEKVIIKQFQIYQRDYMKFEIFIVTSLNQEKKKIETIFCQVLTDVLGGKVELDFKYVENIAINSQTGKQKYFFSMESISIK